MNYLFTFCTSIQVNFIVFINIHWGMWKFSGFIACRLWRHWTIWKRNWRSFTEM